MRGGLGSRRGARETVLPRPRKSELNPAGQPHATGDWPLRELFWATQGVTGVAYFGSLTRALAEILGVRIAFVSRRLAGEPERLELVALCEAGHLSDGFVYATDGTPCARVLQQGPTIIPCGAREHFPDDRWLTEGRIEAYAAVPLLDASDAAIGHLGVADTEAFEDPDAFEPFLSITAALAAAEMERMRSSEALRVSEERLAFTIRGSRDGIWEWLGPKDDVLWWSPVLFEQLGFEADEFAPTFKRFRELLHPDDRKRTVQALNRHFKERVPFAIEYRVRNKNGTYRWYLGRGQAQWDGNGEPTRMTGLLQDITDRKRSEATMRSLVASTAGTTGAEYFATLVTDLCSYFEADFAIIAVRSGAQQMRTLAARLDGGDFPNFSYDNSGLPDEESMLPDASLIERDVCQRFPKVREVLPFQPEGFVGKRLRDRHGSSIGVILALSRRAMSAQPEWTAVLDLLGSRAAAEVERDRVDAAQRDLQEKLQHTQKLEGLGVLAGGIAHDFNNLLVGILGNAELGLLEAEPGSSIHRSLLRIDEAAKRAAELAGQMLAYSGKGRFRIDRVDLASIVKDMARMLNLSVSKRANLVFRLGDELPRVEADVTQLRQIIMNLITNASESLNGEVGVVTLRTGVMDCDVNYLSQTYLNDDLPAGRYVFVEVSDTGSGMDAESMRKMFDPFFTTKFAGRGLGLAAVLGIVRGHRGAIEVASRPGEGSTFRVLLPSAVTLDGDVEAAAITAGKERQATGTVLVVDDEPVVLEVVREMLERIGMTVTTAPNGREALDLYGARANGFDVVVLDLTMPEMDGSECMWKLLRIDPKARVILSSGFTAFDMQQRFASRGFLGFLEKPYSFDALRAGLREVLPGSSRS